MQKDESNQIDGLDGWFQPRSDHTVLSALAVVVGGTYTIQTNGLNDAQLAQLGAILLALPGAQDGSMRFFVTPECDGLEASFEPSGVTVSGKVSAAD